MADTSNWPNKEEAAKLTGVPVRTLERRIAAGDIGSAYRRVAHRRPMVVLNPEDLARLVAEEGAGTAVIMAGPQQLTPSMPPSVAPEPHDNAPTSRQEQGSAPIPHVVLLRRENRSRYVRLHEAAAYIGLPQAYLERLIRDGRLHAIKSGAWFVRTADLDRL